jgi:PAS domain S-box-containing protein
MSTINLLRILIIDDNPQIHKDFIKILAIEELSETRKKLNELEKDIFSDKAKIKKTALPEFLIDTASQGQEGVEKITKAMAEGNPYALAFVDVRMPPGWDGVETIKHIWEIDPDIQVVICSAYSDYSWEETVENLGSRENLLILKKPFDNIAVRQLSCALTKKWQMLQELNLNTLSLEERVKERTKSLQQSLAITRGTLESSADGILVINYDDVIIDYNKKFLDMWNISASLIESKDANKILEHIADQVRDTQDFLAIINKIRKKSDIIKIEKLKTKDGKIFEYYSQPYSLNDKVSGYICSFHDITKRIMLEEDFEHQSTHDVLTGLPNRVLLVDRINQAIGIADEHKSEFGIIFLDLDRFKLINDSLSHAAGDEVLKEVGRRLTSSIRKEDTCARLGGDEFVLVVGIDTPFYMTRICSELIEVFKQPF